ncbi:copper homeostasis protein CutC [Amaricoccus sp. W119]|uniref:copper homeostasis protein CutC n=1 Tax=Amaricoccus sp. W119 TaxID=3391833 RepID=UPI0039A65F8B
MTRVTLEICVDDAAGIAAASEGGADRLELCAALALGGLTPSAGLIALAARSPLPALAMIRPRAGDFVWSEAEREAMRAEIAAVRAAGLAGVVIGASLPDGRLDAGTLAELVAAAAGLDITLHRAIDLTPDPAEAMRLVHDLGIRRVLSSGGARTAELGLARLAVMARAAPEVSVMPGGGISAGNVGVFLTAFGEAPPREIHASCSVPAPTPTLPAVAEFGFQPPAARTTDAGRVRALRLAIDQVAIDQAAV